MNDTNTKLLIRFFTVTILLHIILSVVIIALFYVESNLIYNTIPIGTVIAVINALYWGYKFYVMKGKALQVLAVTMVVPFIFIVIVILRQL